MKMNWLNRLKLRANWPLWLAGLAIVFSLLCLLYAENIPQYPDYSRNQVIYPLLVFIGVRILIIPAVLFTSLIAPGIWALQRRTTIGWSIFGAVLISYGGIVYFTLISGFFGFNLSHFQTLGFDGRIYHVGELKDDSDWELDSTSFIVYECDSLGILCIPIYLSGRYNIYNRYFDISDSKLIADQLENAIYFQTGNDIVYVKDIETDIPSAPVTLPPLASITNTNVVQLTEVAKFVRGSATTLAWSPDGKLLAVGGRFPYQSISDQAGFWIYDLDKLQDKPDLLKINNPGDGVSAQNLIFDSDSQRIIDAGYDGKVRLFDVATHNEIAVMPDLNHSALAINFKEDGDLLVLGDWPLQVWLWDIETSSVQSILDDIQNEPISFHNAVFSPDGSLLAFGEQEITIWDLQNRSIQGTFSLPFVAGSLPQYELAFTADGSKLAYGGYVSILGLWDVKSNSEIGSFDIADNDDFSIFSLAFTPDDSLLATGNFDGTVRIWDVQTQTQLIALEGHTNQVDSVAFNPDGTILASTGRDGTVRLWGVPQS